MASSVSWKGPDQDRHDTDTVPNQTISPCRVRLELANYRPNANQTFETKKPEHPLGLFHY